MDIRVPTEKTSAEVKLSILPWTQFEANREFYNSKHTQHIESYFGKWTAPEASDWKLSTDQRALFFQKDERRNASFYNR